MTEQEQEALKAEMRKTRERVKTWPAWKQNTFGTIPVKQEQPAKDVVSADTRTIDKALSGIMRGKCWRERAARRKACI